MCAVCAVLADDILSRSLSLPSNNIALVRSDGARAPLQNTKQPGVSILESARSAAA